MRAKRGLNLVSPSPSPRPRPELSGRRLAAPLRCRVRCHPRSLASPCAFPFSRESLSVSLLSLFFFLSKNPSRVPWRTRHSPVTQTQTSVQMLTSEPEKGRTKEGSEVWPNEVWSPKFGAWSRDGWTGALWVPWRGGVSGRSRVQEKGSRKRSPNVDGPKSAKFRFGQTAFGQTWLWPAVFLDKRTAHPSSRTCYEATELNIDNNICFSKLVEGARVETATRVLLTWAVIHLVPLVSISISEARAVKVPTDESVEKTFVETDGV